MDREQLMQDIVNAVYYQAEEDEGHKYAEGQARDLINALRSMEDDELWRLANKLGIVPEGGPVSNRPGV